MKNCNVIYISIIHFTADFLLTLRSGEKNDIHTHTHLYILKILLVPLLHHFRIYNFLRQIFTPCIMAAYAYRKVKLNKRMPHSKEPFVSTIYIHGNSTIYIHTYLHFLLRGCVIGEIKCHAPLRKNKNKLAFCHMCATKE